MSKSSLNMLRNDTQSLICKEQKQLLIPTIGAHKAIKSYNETKWRLFARKAQANPFMKEYIVNRDEKYCQWCLEAVNTEGTFQLHHIDYMHECFYDEPIKILKPTKSNLNRKMFVPNCEKCYEKSREYFLQCARRIVLTHDHCNKQINNIFVQGEKMKEDIPYDVQKTLGHIERYLRSIDKKIMNISVSYPNESKELIKIVNRFKGEIEEFQNK